MTRFADRWLGVLIALAVVSVAWIVSTQLMRAGVADAAVGWTLGIWTATALVAGAAFRQRRDTGMYFIALGAALFAGQTAAFNLLPGWIGSGTIAERLADAGVHGAGIATLALAICLAFVHPWWDRRGRPPLPVRTIALAAAASMLAVDLILLAIRPVGEVVASPIGLVRRPTGLLWLVAIANIGLLALTAYRSTKRAPSTWVAGSCVALIAAVLASLALPFAGTPRTAVGALVAVAVLVPAAGLLLLAHPLAAQGRELTRMRRASDRAAEVMEGRAEIAATIAHDVRGPVGTIKGLATTTRKSYDRLGDPERLEFIGMIEQESGRLLRLVDQVAMALKIDAGSLDLHVRRQEVAPLLGQARVQVDTGDRTVTIEAADNLEAPLDTRWFAEAVAQGIDNALRFSPAETDVLVTATTDGRDVVVDIVDGGPGIPLEQREALFEKFSRWRPTGYEDRTGTGLGLFICRGIARTHGGDALLVDRPDGGTMLRIRVPGEEERGA